MSSPPASHVDKVIARKGSLIHKLKAKDTTGQWAYYFLLVEQAQERGFLEVLENHQINDLEAYGKIIASCYGEEPTGEVKNLLKEKYGFEV